jgi:transcriptional regulator with XRE-family HTH domain
MARANSLDTRRSRARKEQTVTDTLEEGAAERIDRHVGARIRRRRREAGVSQAKLAETLGVSFQQVQKYEIGANRVSASTLWRISQVLGVEPGYWYDGLPADDSEAVRYDQAAVLLLTDEGQDLARAYAAIGPRSARLALIAIARELAGNDRDYCVISAADPAGREAATRAANSPRSAAHPARDAPPA